MLQTSLLGGQNSVQGLALAGKFCLAIASVLLQTCLAASPKTLKYGGDFGWVGVYLHRRRKIWDERKEYGNRNIHCDLDSVRSEAVAAGGVQVENLGNRGSEIQVSE